MMYRLLSKNKGRDRNAIAFCSPFVTELSFPARSREFSRNERTNERTNERYVRVMSSARARTETLENEKGRDREKETEFWRRVREEERERESVGICVAIYRSAGRVKEAWKSVSRERTPGKKLPASRKFTAGRFTFGRAQHRRRRPFQEVCPRADGGNTSRNRGRRTNRLFAKLKMHSARDANSFSRASPRVRFLNRLSLYISLSAHEPAIFQQRHRRRTKERERTSLLFFRIILLEKYDGFARRIWTTDVKSIPLYIRANIISIRLSSSSFSILSPRQVFYFNRRRSHSAARNESTVSNLEKGTTRQHIHARVPFGAFSIRATSTGASFQCFR